MKRSLKDAEKRLKEQGWSFRAEMEAHGRYRTKSVLFRHPTNRSLFHVHAPDDEPAIIKRHVPTNVVVREEWRFRGLHRENGPARILRDRDTGNIVQQDWCDHGRHHRAGEAAVIKYDRVTGAVVYEAFFENGKKLSDRSYPENETNASPRMIAARGRRTREKSAKAAAAPC